MKSLLIALLLIPALAMAADEAKPKKSGKGGTRPQHEPAAIFKKLDSNTDASLSLDEFKASGRAKKNPDKAEKIYGKLDKDSDGKVTLEEFKTRAPKKAGKAKPDAPKSETPVPDTSKKEV